MREKDELDHDIEPTPIAGEGELEIEYSGIVDILSSGIVSVDLKCTVAYRYWSIEVGGVDAEYSFVGSVNYLPSGFEQLIRDYLYELPELKGQRINQLNKI